MGKCGVIGMKDIKKMSDAELEEAIDFYMDMGTNLTSHGQADDYFVGSLKLAQFYQEELKRREKSREKEEISV